MKYAIISDIHSNLEAFNAVVNAIKKEKVDKYLFAGDVVGYGANPSECINEFKKLNCLGVAGNHDWGVLGSTSLEYFNKYARKAAEWTAEKLSKKEKKILETLPLTKKIDNITLVHATLENPEKWDYLRSTYQAHKNIDIQETQITFTGHSHVPVAFFEPIEITGPIRFTKEEEIPINKDYKYIINVGSVGQPRDGNPKACYAIYDNEKQVVKIKRVAYNIKKAQDKIRAAELPEILAERLERGE